MVNESTFGILKVINSRVTDHRKLSGEDILFDGSLLRIVSL